MSKSFRDIEKSPLPLQVPPEVASKVAVLAAQSGQSKSAIASAILCQAIGLNPNEYGLKPFAPSQPQNKRNRKLATAS